MDLHGIDIGPILAALASLVTVAITWAAKKVAAKAAADTAKTKTETAALKLAALATSLAGRAWDKLSVPVQKALADGTISADERAEIEAVVAALVKDFTSEDDLNALADALGRPLPGLIAKLAALILGIFARAHDPDIKTESSLAFPVGTTVVQVTDPETQAEIDKANAMGG